MIDIPPFAVFGDWDDTPTPKDRLRIVMPPLGHVFGGGWHPFTKSAINAIINYLKPGMSFLDVGAGSGILCVVAKLLGAADCYAVELDKDALAVLPKVFKANKVDVHVIDGTYGDWRGTEKECRKHHAGHHERPKGKRLTRQIEENHDNFDKWWEESNYHVKKANDNIAIIPFVDLAIISISSNYVNSNKDKIKANKILTVEDDGRVECYNA